MNTLEDLLNEAISPSNRHYNSDTVRRIAELINKEPNGPPFALRLIAHKIQSPQDREALTALNLLNSLIKQCNPLFLSELGKFKFLNEIIKVLSPKYLADQCTPAVKQKCAQLLYEWQRDYADKEPKISEAYNMLCRQGIINPEELSSNCPLRSDRSANADNRRQVNIFDRSRQSERLTKLLRSRNPADVAEANRLIKTIVEEDQLRLEQVTQRSTEMEALKNNTLLLEEMMSTYERGEASEAELELMSELAQNIRRARPILYNFSLTHDENDIQTLTEIACICDHASTALTLYEQKLVNPTNGNRLSQRTTMPDSLSNRNDKQVEKDLLSQDLLALGLDDDENLNTVPIIAPAASLPQALPAPATFTQPPYRAAKSDASRYEELADIFANVSFTGPVTVAPTTRTSGSYNPAFSSGGPLSVLSPQSPSNGQPVARNGQTAANTSKTKVFDDLDALGRSMLGLPVQKPSAHDSSDQKASTLTDISTRHIDTTLLNDSVRSACQITSSLEHQVELTNLDLSLSAIQPHPTLTTPFTVFPREASSEPGVQLALHYAGNRPAPSVRVFVAVITSRSSLPVTDVHVRFGLSKPLSIRQLAPSGHSLAAYSPFLPAGAINQIVLVSDPVNQPTIALKYQLSFNLDGEAVLESGTVDLPVI